VLEVFDPPQAAKNILIPKINRGLIIFVLINPKIILKIMTF